MENLTKQQIVLVTLLVSFVTSIATGIVTVSLMDQAPKAMTQTINRVVERTIEKVVPATNQSAAVVTKETVVVKADDYVIQSVEKNAGSLFRVKKIEETDGVKTETFTGLGFVVSKDGLIALDANSVAPILDEAGNWFFYKYIGMASDGKVYDLTRVGADESSGIAIYKVLAKDSKDTVKKSVFTPASFGDSASLKLGQTIISLGGAEQNSVSVGIVQSLIVKSDASANASTTDSKKISDKNILAIKTDLKQTNEVAGAVLLDLYGNIVGFKAGAEINDKNSYLPINLVNSAIFKIISATTTKTN